MAYLFVVSPSIRLLVMTLKASAYIRVWSCLMKDEESATLTKFEAQPVSNVLKATALSKTGAYAKQTLRIIPSPFERDSDLKAYKILSNLKADLKKYSFMSHQEVFKHIEHGIEPFV